MMASTTARKLWRALTVPGAVGPYLRKHLRVLPGLLRDGGIEVALVFCLTVVGLHAPYLRWRSGPDAVARDVDGHTMHLDVAAEGITKNLLFDGVHERRSTALFTEAIETLATDETAVLDIGANVGYYALIEARALASRGTVYAIEPDPTNLALLERNVAVNGYDEAIEIAHGAISDTDGVETLYLNTSPNWNRLEAPAGQGETVGTRSVRTWSVGSFLDRRGLDYGDVGVLRMDIEGYEVRLLDDVVALLDAPGERVLFIELHPRAMGPDALDAMLDALSVHELLGAHTGLLGRATAAEAVFEDWAAVFRACHEMADEFEGVEVLVGKHGD